MMDEAINDKNCVFDDDKILESEYLNPNVLEKRDYQLNAAKKIIAELAKDLKPKAAPVEEIVEDVKEEPKVEEKKEETVAEVVAEKKEEVKAEEKKEEA